MGTDLTLFAEHTLDPGTWSLADPAVENPALRYWDPDDPDDPRPPEQVPRTINLGRNSKLFALLAGVTARRFIESPFSPIAPDRGLPHDLSPIGREFADSCGEGTFGHSWILASELWAFNWTQLVQLRAMVDPQVAPLFANNPIGFPHDRWPADVKRSYAEFSSGGVVVRWRERWSSAAGLTILEKELGQYPKDHSTRFVFWFDR